MLPKERSCCIPEAFEVLQVAFQKRVKTSQNFSTSFQRDLHREGQGCAFVRLGLVVGGGGPSKGGGGRGGWGSLS
ncbi:unnamed protein product [Ectocarpus sp. 4 AP-2014]